MQPWEYRPFPTQRRFHLDLRTFVKGYSGPVGSGKSHALCYEAIFLAQLNQGLPGMIGAPTNETMRRSTQTAFFEILESERLSFSFHKTEKRIRLTDVGSDILFQSLEEPDRVRGPNLAWAGVDELTYCKEAVWKPLEARVRHPKAVRRCVFAVWTPKGWDWVYEKFLSPGTQGYKLYQASPRENKALPADYYDNLKRSYGDRFFRQEALGEYLNLLSGEAYYAFDRNLNVKPLGYMTGDVVCWALDFNISEEHPMSSVIAQLQKPTWREANSPTIVNVLDEIRLTKSSVWAACEQFEEKTREWVRREGHLNVRVYGDASGNSHQHATGATCYQMIKEYFRVRPEYHMTYFIKATNPAVRDRVNAVNAKLCNFEGVRTLFIDPKCKGLRKDFEQVCWKVDANKNMTGGLDKKAGLTDVSDALGYLIEKEFPLVGRYGPVGDRNPLFN